MPPALLHATICLPYTFVLFLLLSTRYPLLHINAHSNAIAKALRPEDVDPVLLVTLPEATTAL
jgi:hypothetical protein